MAPSSKSTSRQRHVPLEQDLLATGPLKTKSKKRKERPDHEDGVEGGYVDSRSSQKILKIGQELAEEEQLESLVVAPNPAFAFESRFGVDCEPEKDDEGNDDEAWGDEDDGIVGEVVRDREILIYKGWR